MTLNAQQSTIRSYNYQLNTANQRARTTLADGSYWLYTYDSLGQVISGKRFWQDGTPVAGQQYEYGFDDIGNRKSASMGGDANGSPLRQARYDTPYPPNRLNQYVQRDVPAVVDIMGIANPSASVTVNNNTAYRKGEYYDYALSTPNTSGLWYNTVTVHSSYGGGQDSTGKLFVPKSQELFAYDPDGNLTNDGHWAYVWDAENRLVRMTNNATTGPQQGLTFEYDWSGRRIHKQVWSQGVAPTNNVKFLYDGWNLLAELNATNNAVIRSFLWGSDLSGSPQGAGGVGGLLEMSYTGAQTTNCFVAFDGNGNVAALADAASTNILAQYEYGPFGELLRATGPMAKTNPFRFSTKYQDDEADLLYYGYRFFNPNTGRWLSRDPIGEKGGANLYGFAGNDGINHYDKLGKQFCGYNCMPRDCNGVPDGPIRQTGCDVFMALLDRWRSGNGWSYEIPSDVMDSMMGAGQNPSDIEQMKGLLKTRCKRYGSGVMEHIIYDSFTTSGSYCEAWYLGGHTRKFTGLANCCSGEAQICLEVTDTWDFDEHDKWPKGGDAGDKIKYIGSICTGAILDLGKLDWPVAVPVHGKKCINVKL